ncbi:hypothetical protein GWK47_020556 [Chionoecetes opilio]|uniref:Uncharacterized protein n=1 Tax=Chionoecetes opilio TaxID=41210 RepID=A0A8J4XR06_CHIOP|nr:hypothetical protein GWK47_020556 [Chionoecetes opilio]
MGNGGCGWGDGNGGGEGTVSLALDSEEPPSPIMGDLLLPKSILLKSHFQDIGGSTLLKLQEVDQGAGDQLPSTGPKPPSPGPGTSWDRGGTRPKYDPKRPTSPPSWGFPAPYSEGPTALSGGGGFYQIRGPTSGAPTVPSPGS